MRDDVDRFALVAFPATTPTGRPTIMSITEDAVPAARSRKWMVLGRDSDVLTAEIALPPPLLSNPRRTPENES